MPKLQRKRCQRIRARREDKRHRRPPKRRPCHRFVRHPKSRKEADGKVALSFSNSGPPGPARSSTACGHSAKRYAKPQARPDIPCHHPCDQEKELRACPRQDGVRLGIARDFRPFGTLAAVHSKSNCVPGHQGSPNDASHNCFGRNMASARAISRSLWHRRPTTWMNRGHTVKRAPWLARIERAQNQRSPSRCRRNGSNSLIHQFASAILAESARKPSVPRMGAAVDARPSSEHILRPLPGLPHLKGNSTGQGSGS